MTKPYDKVPVTEQPSGMKAYQDPDRSEPLFICSDQWERRIVLSARQWHEHITLEHPEMVRLLNFVEWSIARPNHVRFDRVHPFRECFYLRHRRGARSPELLIKTVVHFDPTVSKWFEADGFVVTSFLMRRVHPKEAIKWS